MVKTKNVKSDHITPSDGLRGLAVTLVFLYHTTLAASFVASSGSEKIATKLLSCGWIGVDIFFALSGFLITRILLNSKNSSGYFSTFYLRRTLRIFPLYYFFLLLVFLLPYSVIERLSAGALDVKAFNSLKPWFVFYLQNWLIAWQGTGFKVPIGQLWSLAVEEQFYILWPLVVFHNSNRRLIKISIAVCIALPCLRFTLAANGLSDTSIYVSTLTRADSLLAGALLATWLREEYRLPSFKTINECLLPFFLCGAVLIEVLDHGLKRNGIALQTIGYPLVSFSSAGVIFVCLSRHETFYIVKTLNIPALRFVGRYSYSIYIFHLPVLYGMASFLKGHTNILGPGTTLFSISYVYLVLASGAITILISLITWNLLERHFLALKVWFSRGSQLPSI